MKFFIADKFEPFLGNKFFVTMNQILRETFLCDLLDNFCAMKKNIAGNMKINTYNPYSEFLEDGVRGRRGGFYSITTFFFRAIARSAVSY